VLVEAAALGVDAVLFSANAGTADAPAGLLNGVSPVTASTATVLSDAMAQDLANIGAAVARVAGKNVAFIAAPEQALAIALFAPMFAYPVLATKALAKGTVIAVATSALVSAFDPVPAIEASREATVHWDDSAPAEIVGSGGAVAQPVGTVFQSDSVLLRMRMLAAWALRSTNAIAFVQNVVW
jgi:hypothetical protein